MIGQTDIYIYITHLILIPVFFLTPTKFEEKAIEKSKWNIYLRYKRINAHQCVFIFSFMIFFSVIRAVHLKAIRINRENPILVEITLLFCSGCEKQIAVAAAARSVHHEEHLSPLFITDR